MINRQDQAARRPRIKICGLSRPCDIAFVNESGPDYIGFVFAKSRRQVTKEQAAGLRRQLSEAITPVGVFVNADPEEIVGLVKDRVIDAVQLHGQENEAYMQELRERLREVSEEAEEKAYSAQTLCPIIKAFSVSCMEDVKKACESSADYILLDNGAGGTGQRFDWKMIGDLKRPYFLAGGLGPDNIEEAMQYGAFALDVSSGVETDGFKDREKIEMCVRRVRT